MLKLLGQVSLAAGLMLVGASAASAQSYILGADDFPFYGTVEFATGSGTGNTVAETEANDDYTTANAMVLGDDYSGDISVGTDVDYASFTVAANDQILFQTVDISGLGDTQLRLYDTDGTTLLEFDDDDGPGLLSLINYTFTVAGTYYMEVASFSTNTGLYLMETRTVTVSNTVDEWYYIQRALEEISGGVTRTNDGSVAVLGSLDSTAITFNGGGAYHYSVPLAAANSSLTGTVNFYDGATDINNFFADLALNNVMPQIIALPGSGASNDLDATEGAALGTNAAAIAGFINSGGGLISHGDDFTAGISYTWLDTFISGATVTLDSFTQDITDRGSFELAGVDGGHLSDFGRGYFSGVALPVYVDGPGQPVTGPGTGNTVNETEANDDHTTANAIVIGDDYDGDISVGSDEDYCSVTVAANDQILFQTIDISGLGDTQLTLYDTDGTTQLEFDDDDGPALLSLINYTFASAGTYFVKVGSFSTNTGLYKMECRTVTTGDRVPVVIGETPGGAWGWKGNQLDGVNGKPLAVGAGSLASGSAFTLDITNGESNAMVGLIFGTAEANLPFKGGTLVPSVSQLFVLMTDGNGEIHIADNVAATVPSSTTYYGHAWIQDGTAVAGYSATNAFSMTTP